jgi:hypothetical protein
MRWPLRRRAAAPAGGNGAAEAAVRPLGQWRGLPAVARALGPQPTAGSRGFAATLPSRWQQPAALGPLGHDLTAEAPGGLVSGLARGTDLPPGNPPAARVPRTPSGPPAMGEPVTETSRIPNGTPGGSLASPPVPDGQLAPARPRRVLPERAGRWPRLARAQSSGSPGGSPPAPNPPGGAGPPSRLGGPGAGTPLPGGLAPGGPEAEMPLRGGSRAGRPARPNDTGDALMSSQRHRKRFDVVGPGGFQPSTFQPPASPGDPEPAAGSGVPARADHPAQAFPADASAAASAGRIPPASPGRPEAPASPGRPEAPASWAAGTARRHRGQPTARATVTPQAVTAIRSPSAGQRGTPVTTQPGAAPAADTPIAYGPQEHAGSPLAATRLPADADAGAPLTRRGGAESAMPGPGSHQARPPASAPPPAPAQVALARPAAGPLPDGPDTGRLDTGVRPAGPGTEAASAGPKTPPATAPGEATAAGTAGQGPSAGQRGPVSGRLRRRPRLGPPLTGIATGLAATQPGTALPPDGGALAHVGAAHSPTQAPGEPEGQSRGTSAGLAAAVTDVTAPTSVTERGIIGRTWPAAQTAGLAVVTPRSPAGTGRSLGQRERAPLVSARLPSGPHAPLASRTSFPPGTETSGPGPGPVGPGSATALAAGQIPGSLPWPAAAPGLPGAGLPGAALPGAGLSGAGLSGGLAAADEILAVGSGGGAAGRHLGPMLPSAAGQRTGASSRQPSGRSIGLGGPVASARVDSGVPPAPGAAWEGAHPGGGLGAAWPASAGVSHTWPLAMPASRAQALSAGAAGEAVLGDSRNGALRPGSAAQAAARYPAATGLAPAGPAPFAQLPAGQLPAGQLPAGQLPAGSAPAGSVAFGPASAGPASAGPAATATATAADPTDPAVLDRLAQRIYGRLRGHLAAELLADRERAQLLTDL